MHACDALYGAPCVHLPCRVWGCGGMHACCTLIFIASPYLCKPTADHFGHDCYAGANLDRRTRERHTIVPGEAPDLEPGLVSGEPPSRGATGDLAQRGFRKAWEAARSEMSATFTALHTGPAAFLGRGLVGKARAAPPSRAAVQISAASTSRPLWAPGTFPPRSRNAP